MELNPYHEGEASARAKPSDYCNITNDQNQSLFPTEYLGQLNHRPPPLKSLESHEVSKIGARGVHQKITSAYYLENTTVPLLLVKLKASGLTPWRPEPW